MADGAVAEPVTGSAKTKTRRRREPTPARKALSRAFKLIAFFFVFIYFGLPAIAGLRSAAGELIEVQPAFLVAGFGLQFASLLCYSQLTRAALPAGVVSLPRLFRIQLATKAVGNVLPAGTAASSAFGYRLLTLSGVNGPDAGFALATAGIGSAVMLNLILWVSLLISIPLRGFNPLYVTAAIIGVLLMGFAAVLVVGLMKGVDQAEGVVARIAHRLRLDGERAGEVVRHLADRLDGLLREPELVRKVLFWATLNWLLDAASLWVFLRAFGGVAPIDGLLVSFGVANVAAALPITPGGLGVVEGIYVPLLVGFGLPRRIVALGVPAYRLAQYWLPIPIGALCYLSLRVGPWSIERRDRLARLREEAERAAGERESGLVWAERYGFRPTDPTVPMHRPEDDLPTPSPGGPEPGPASAPPAGAEGGDGERVGEPPEAGR
jgi:uncharacterized protein (TIRG00374 family)